jgi:hypothetical protein
MVGQTARTLGIRPEVDVTADGLGMVTPGTGGMSVAPSWRDLPSHRIPLHLQSIVRDACGNKLDRCWRMGAGSFIDSPVTESLNLHCDRDDHGCVEPSRRMELNGLQSVLAETRDLWVIDEA